MQGVQALGMRMVSTCAQAGKVAPSAAVEGVPWRTAFCRRGRLRALTRSGKVSVVAMCLGTPTCRHAEGLLRTLDQVYC